MSKIAIITEAWPQVSGVMRTYQNISGELEAAGDEVKIIHPRMFALNVPCPTYPDIRLAFNTAASLGRMIEDFEPDYIHIPTEGPLGHAAQDVCTRMGLPRSSAYHTHFAQYIAKRAPFFKTESERLAQRVIRDFHNRSSRVMVVSDQMQKYLRGIGVRSPIRQVGRGVDTSIFHPGPSPHSGGNRLALYVGRVSVEKNIEDFLKLDLPGFRKIVVGEGPSRGELMARYKDVEFPGFREGKVLADYYRAADVFVFPSKTDTFGIVLIEALACGAPVAAYDEGGHLAILTDEMYGSAGPDLAKAVASALAAPGSREDRHRAITRQHSWSNAAQQFRACLVPVR